MFRRFCFVLLVLCLVSAAVSCGGSFDGVFDMGFLGELGYVEVHMGDYDLLVVPFPVDDFYENALAVWPVPVDVWDYGHSDEELVERAWVMNTMTSFSGRHELVPVYDLRPDSVRVSPLAYGFRPLTEKEFTWCVYHHYIDPPRVGLYVGVTVLPADEE